MSSRARQSAFTLTIAAAIVLGASIGIRARAPQAAQPPAQQQPAPPAAPAPRPLVPLTAASIARDLDRHLGANASMMASVESVLSKTVFVVDQDTTRSTGQDVVVIAPTLTETPGLNRYLTVQGEVIRFDPDEIAKRARGYTLDLPADVVARYRGRPAIVATAIITAVPAVRGGLEKPDAAAMRTQLLTLRQAFTEVQGFFKGRGAADATGWATESLGIVAKMDAAAASGKWEDVKTSVGGLQQLCTSCHNAYRDRMDDGTFRIRGGE